MIKLSDCVKERSMFNLILDNFNNAWLNVRFQIQTKIFGGINKGYFRAKIFSLSTQSEDNL